MKEKQFPDGSMADINQLYEGTEAKQQIIAYLNEQEIKVITLNNFLHEQEFASIKKNLQESKFDLEFTPTESKYEFKKNELKELETNIKQFIQSLFNKKLSIKTSIIKKIKSGYYTILSDKPEKKKIKVFYYLKKEIPHIAGGYHVFVKEDSILLHPEENSLTLFLTDKSKDFIKYVDSRAEKKENIFLELELK